MQADSQGIIQIVPETDSGLFASGNNIVFSAPGYIDYGLSAATLPETFTVTLTKKVNPELALGIGAGAAILLLAGKKNKLIGAAEKQSRKAGLPSWVLPVGAL